MYLAHFRLAELPFGITPDTAYAFCARAHQEALNTLQVSLANGEGFIKITGEVGSGKTLLCRRFLAHAGPNMVSAYVPNPMLSPRTLLLAVAEELRVELDPDTDEHRMLKALNRALLEFAAQDKIVVLCLDEAQALPMESLEAVRLLSNLETEKRKLLHVVLFGQPELDARLADPSVRQLRQRIAFSYRLTGLCREELALYLRHRLHVAGYRGNDDLFCAPAAAALHRASRGIPRVVNILAHKSLLALFGEGGQRVLPRHVACAVSDSGEAVRPGFRAWGIEMAARLRSGWS